LCLNKNENSYICTNCLKDNQFYLKLLCFKCSKLISKELKTCHKNSTIKFLISFSNYENEKIRNIVLTAKNQSYEIFNDLAYFIAKQLKNSSFYSNLKDFYLVPVPLTKKSLLKRGFNQAEVLAYSISIITNLPLSNSLIKLKDTLDQSQLNYKQRLSNLKQAFDVKDKPPLKVILVDDIKTTGATLKECAETLKRNGTKEVIALTILY
jgi:competence protein ComFC